MNFRQSTIVLLLLVVGTGAIWDSKVVQRVRTGVRHFAAGEFEKAAEEFAAADSELPDNRTVQFDRAATLTAMGKPEDATEFYQQAALARSAPLSAAAHYNMGNIAANRAQQLLGDDPVNVASEQREEVLSELLSAVGHYRDCLRVESGHDNARHNLELIRLFIKHIQAEWEKRDRQKAREELGLLEFLAMIEQKQILLRQVAKELTDEQESPQRRQAIRETADSQRQLQEEIEPLKQKIAAELQVPAGQQPSPDDDQTQQVKTLLDQLADDAAAAILRSSDQLQSADLRAARETQLDSLAQLNQIYMVLVPFNRLLQRAIQTQEGLVSQSETSLPDTNQDEEDSQDEPASSPPTTFDFDQNTWHQIRVTDWARLLSLKAAAELPQVQEQLTAAKASAEATESVQPPADDNINEQSPTDGGDSAQTEASPDPTQQQLQAQVDVRQTAVELAPQVEQHSLTAQQELQQQQVTEALPEQQEALKLLKEIAKPLKQDQGQQDNEDEQQNQDQQQDKQQEPDSSQQDSDEKKKQDQDSKPEGDKQQQQEQQQAESVLRRAREREREHREQQKKLRRILGGLIPVDKDW